MALGDKAAALALSEQAMTVVPLEKDAVNAPFAIDVLARVAAQLGEPDRAIAALQTLLSIPSEAALAPRVPLTTALLRLDPMFDPLGTILVSGIDKETTPKASLGRKIKRFRHRDESKDAELYFRTGAG